jgi:hypothetical protein
MEEGSLESMPVVKDRFFNVNPIGCLAERKLPTRLAWPRNHAQTSSQISTTVSAMSMAAQAGAEGGTAWNQYVLADVGCHLSYFRTHATDSREHKLPLPIFTHRGHLDVTQRL